MTLLWISHSSAPLRRELKACNTHPPGAVLATCSQSFCLLPKTRCELGAGSTGSTLLFLALLECCFSALLFCLLSLHFDHVRKLLFGLAALSQNNNPPPRPVTCCWTVMEKHSCDKVNNKLPAGRFYRKAFLFFNIVSQTSSSFLLICFIDFILIFKY